MASDTSPPGSTRTTVAEPGLDLDADDWVIHGFDGLVVGGHQLLHETVPLPAGVARDRQGGLVVTDSAGLWWIPAGALDPTHVRAGVFELLVVTETSAGPGAMVWNGEVWVYLLDGGELVQIDRGETSVGVSSKSP